jgi:DNA-binding transcriptional regulator YbjK
MNDETLQKLSNAVNAILNAPKGQIGTQDIYAVLVSGYALHQAREALDELLNNKT